MFPPPQTKPASPPNEQNAIGKAFYNKVYQALLQSFNAAQSGSPGYTSVLPAITLSGGLLTENQQVILPLIQSTPAQLSQPRAGLVATTVGSLALFAGGIDNSGSPSDTLYIYDATTRTWRETLHLSSARSQIAATTVGSLTFFVGGTKEI